MRLNPGWKYLYFQWRLHKLDVLGLNVENCIYLSYQVFKAVGLQVFRPLGLYIMSGFYFYHLGIPK